MRINKIEGLIAASFTPFHDDGKLHLEMIPPLVEKYVQDGLKGIFVGGSNGEGPNMTLKERMMLSEAFVKAAAGRLMIIVHAGHACIADARALAAHAADIGADAVSSVAAFYFKPRTVDQLTNSMAAIAAGAGELPFYYYHIPHLTGLNFDMTRFLSLADGLIPNLAGIKYTAHSLQEFQACLEWGNRKYDILFGLDELLLPAMAVGAIGAIGSTYSFAAPMYYKTMELIRSNQWEKARLNHGYMCKIIQIFLEYPSIPAQKAIMKMLGWDLGPCRLPLETLSANQYQSLFHQLEQISFTKYFPTRKQIAED